MPGPPGVKDAEDAARIGADKFVGAIKERSPEWRQRWLCYLFGEYLAEAGSFEEIIEAATEVESRRLRRVGGAS